MCSIRRRVTRSNIDQHARYLCRRMSGAVVVVAANPGECPVSTQCIAGVGAMPAGVANAYGGGLAFGEQLRATGAGGTKRGSGGNRCLGLGADRPSVGFEHAVFEAAPRSGRPPATTIASNACSSPRTPITGIIVSSLVMPKRYAYASLTAAGRNRERDRQPPQPPGHATEIPCQGHRSDRHAAPTTHTGVADTAAFGCIRRPVRPRSSPPSRGAVHDGTRAGTRAPS